MQALSLDRAMIVMELAFCPHAWDSLLTDSHAFPHGHSREIEIDRTSRRPEIRYITSIPAWKQGLYHFVFTTYASRSIIYVLVECSCVATVLNFTSSINMNIDMQMNNNFSKKIYSGFYVNF
jgi:hypothetical protein